VEFDKDPNPQRQFVQIVMNVVKQLEGTFALLFTSRHYPNEIIACRKGSPLIVGKDDKDTYTFSSDTSALVSSKSVCVLKDNELMHIGNSKVGVMNMLTRGTVTDKIDWTTNKVTLSDVDKGNFDSFMEKEIFEQPSSLYKTIHNNTFLDSKNHVGFKIPPLSHHKNAFCKANNVILIACGTSYHSCVASRLILSKVINKDVYVEVAGQFSEVRPKLSNNNVYIFVSQSGETADTLDALRYVLSYSSALCVGITNKPESAIARECHCSIDLKAGLEISVASTKAYTSQMTMFLIMALAIKNELYDGKAHTDILDMQMATIRIPDVVKGALLGTNYRMKALADEIKDFRSIFFIGRGNDYATALEAALKVKEIAYVHSEGLMASELKHGPLAMIDDNVCLFVFATRNQFYGKMVSVIEQLNARNGKLYVICNDDDEKMSSIIPDKSRLIRVPSNHEITQHIINIIPMQLLAFHLATSKGFKVDQPRNLAKSVTVSD
jgi:glucosamine--fructose-6-phosphate aminotransferase (isomerizing)